MKRLRLSLEDRTLLRKYVELGAKHPDVGYEDIETQYLALTGNLTRYEKLDPEMVESALWSCVLMGETGKWTECEPLDLFVQRLTPPGYRFNWDYCYFEELEK